MKEHSVSISILGNKYKWSIGHRRIWHRKDEERCNSLLLEVMRPVCVKLFALIRNFVDYSKLD